MERVAALLPALFRQLKLLPALNTPIWRALWQSHVGSAMAAHTQVSHFENGVLTVVVDHHAWHQQLLRMKGDLIPALNQTYGRPILKDLQLIYRDSGSGQSASEG